MLGAPCARAPAAPGPRPGGASPQSPWGFECKEVSASTVFITSCRNSFPKPSSLRRELSPGVPTRLTDTLSQVPEPRRELVATRTVYLLMSCHLGVRSAAGNEAGLAGCKRESRPGGGAGGSARPHVPGWGPVACALTVVSPGAATPKPA